MESFKIEIVFSDGEDVFILKPYYFTNLNKIQFMKKIGETEVLKFLVEMGKEAEKILK